MHHVKTFLFVPYHESDQIIRANPTGTQIKMLRVSSYLLTGIFAKGGGSRSGGGPRVFDPNRRPSEATRFHYEVRVPHMKKMARMVEMTEHMDNGARKKEAMAHNKRLLYRSSVARETKELQRQQRSDRQSQVSQTKHFPPPSDASRRLSGGSSSQAAASNLRRLR